MKYLVQFFLCILCFAHALPTTAQDDDSRTLLAIFAHADDELLVSPILAKYAREGANVHLVIATRGEKWAPQTDLSPGDAIAEVRAKEARCAAEALGIHPPIQLAFDDGSLGRRVQPPWQTLSQLESRLHELMHEHQPDVIITWGPDGGYGHPEHRLVGAVVTQLVQQDVDGAPEELLYAGIPKGRVPTEPPPGQLPYEPTDTAYLTVRVPYSEADLAATQESFQCYRSQFPLEQLEQLPMQAHAQVWQGEVFLRPWFRAVEGSDVFALGDDGNH